MIKKLVTTAVLMLSLVFISCSKEENTQEMKDDSKSISADPEKPGTYFKENKANRYWTDGCKSRNNYTCVIVVSNSQISFDRKPFPVDDAFKEEYIKSKLSEVIINLNPKELEIFKSTLEFNSDKKMISWDLELLRKGAPKTLKTILAEISVYMGGDAQNLYIMDKEGKEIKL
ncbi:hypothetical protein [Myroides odoratus]|uniref:hypothetical protein n=1 Tax=Myroides odoratus TaxID=256 RepID=UPI00333F2257